MGRVVLSWLWGGRDRRFSRVLMTTVVAILLWGWGWGLAIWPLHPSLAQEPSASTGGRSEIRGVWLTNIDSDVLFSSQKLEAGLQRLHDLNFNTIYPTIWQNGQTLYPSQVAEAVVGQRMDSTPGLQGRDPLAEAVEQGHKFGLAVVPWFEFGLMLPGDSPIAQNHPDWITQRRDGSQVWLEGSEKRVWLNPAHPEVRQFITAFVAEVVARYEVDGFQMDDHLGMPMAFGYDPYTVRLYRREHGGQMPPEDPQNPAWVRWRSAKVTELMTQVFHTVKALKPNCFLSLSPNPYEFAYSQYLQDWQRWQEMGLIEELLVQVYRNDFERFKAELAHPTVRRVSRRIPTGIGILTGLKGRPVEMAQIRKQVEWVRQQGLAGVSFFFYETLGKRDRDFLELFPTPMQRPQR